MYSRRALLSAVCVGAALWTPVSCQRQVEFFYSPQNDTCAYGTQSFEADGNSDHGGICAYTPAKSRLYACPAPDPTCWTWDQTCGGGATAAGPGQIFCESGTYTWCCLDSETCTTTEGQINVCISDFSSPNSGVSLSKANSVELQALGVASVGTAVETANPSVFSTRTVDSTGALYTSSSKTSITSTSTGKTSKPTTSVVNTQSSASSSTSRASLFPETSSSSSTIATGTIVGLVIGALAAIAIIAVLVWAIMRRRYRKKSAAASSGNAVEKDSDVLPTAYAQHQQKQDHKAFAGEYYQPQQPVVHEADPGNMVRAELPSNSYPRGELP